MDRFFNGGEEEFGGRLAGFGVDIREDPDHYFVEADLPGFRKEDVDLTLDAGNLTITAERRQQKGPPPGTESKSDKEKDYLLHERRYERFQRSFTLPANVDEQHVQAKLEDGCLTITLNKTEQSKPKKISVG
jgi:HSP20 family protein